MDADGGDVRLLTPPPTGFTNVGSPEWSADGRRIAFDTSTGSTTTSHVFVVKTDGSELNDLGLGCMPSFSRDGKQIVMSQPGKGIVMMDADGSNRRVIDSRGWGVQFSPDGKYLAYGKSGNITLMNVQTEEQRELLVGEHADRYSYVYWNLGWSHDGRSIAFKGRNRKTGVYEVAAVDVGTPNELTVLYSSTGNISADFAFSPDNKQVLFALNLPDHPGFGLYAVSRENPGPPKLLPGHPADHKIYNAAVSPDRKRIAFSSQKTPQPVDWSIHQRQGREKQAPKQGS